MENKPQPPQILADAISREMVAGATHVNVAQEYIVITEDRTYRCLNTWKNKIESRDRWIAPVSLVAGLTLAFVTATFNDAFGIPKNTWQAFFMLAIGLSVYWAARELWAKFRTGKGCSVKDVIEELKKGSLTVQWSATEDIEAVKTHASPQ